MIQDTKTRISSLNPPCGGSSALPVVDAASLMKGGSLVVIQFRGETYQLRLTRAGKLILTK